MFINFVLIRSRADGPLFVEIKWTERVAAVTVNGDGNAMSARRDLYLKGRPREQSFGIVINRYAEERTAPLSEFEYGIHSRFNFGVTGDVAGVAGKKLFAPVSERKLFRERGDGVAPFYAEKSGNVHRFQAALAAMVS